MSQLCLPGMREQGWGRIVNIGSMGGKLTFPGGGIYHATKYSVEAISDAMRFETRGFGVNVVLIEPGLIVTEFGNAAVASIDEASPTTGLRRVQPPRRQDDRRRIRGAHGEARRRPGRRREGDRQGDLVEPAAPEVHRDPSARLSIAQRKLVTDRGWDRLMRTQFPTPGTSVWTRGSTLPVVLRSATRGKNGGHQRPARSPREGLFGGQRISRRHTERASPVRLR